MTADDDLSTLPLWALEAEAKAFRAVLADRAAREEAFEVGLREAGVSDDVAEIARSGSQRYLSIHGSGTQARLDQLDAAIRDRREGVET